MKNSDDAVGKRDVPPRPPLQRKSTINYEAYNYVTLPFTLPFVISEFILAHSVMRYFCLLVVNFINATDRK
jgi:hypothetical protein